MPEAVPTPDVVSDAPIEADAGVVATAKGYAGAAIEHARLFRLLKFLGLVGTPEGEKLLLEQKGPSGSQPPSSAMPPSGAVPPSGDPAVGSSAQVTPGGPNVSVLRAPVIPVDVQDKVPDAVGKKLSNLVQGYPEVGIPPAAAMPGAMPPAIAGGLSGGGVEGGEVAASAGAKTAGLAGELMRWARRTGDELARHGAVRRDITDTARQLRYDNQEVKELTTQLNALREGRKALGKSAPPNMTGPVDRVMHTLHNPQLTGRLDIAQQAVNARQRQLLNLQDQLGDLQQRERRLAGVGALGVLGSGAATLGDLSDPGVFEYIGFKESSDNPFERVMRTKFAQAEYYVEDPYADQRHLMSRQDLQSMGAVTDEDSLKQVAQMAALGLGAGGAYMMTPWGAEASAKRRLQPIRDAVLTHNAPKKFPSYGAPKGIPYQLARKELRNMGLDVEDSLRWYQKLPGVDRTEHIGRSMDKLERELARKIRARRMLPFMLMGGGLGLGLMSRARREAEDIGDVFNA